MSKRPLDSGSTNHAPLNKKRVKVDVAQHRIDNFFSTRNVTNIHQPEAPSGTGAPASKPGPRAVEVIDVDLFSDGNGITISNSTQQGTHTRNQQNAKSLRRLGATADPRMLSSFSSLGVDPVFYEIDSQNWLGTNAPFAFLSYTLATLAQTRSRILIINCLTNTLRTLFVRDSSSLLPALYLLSNSLGPPYEAVELGVGPSMISQAIQQISGLSAAAVKKLSNSLGDPGDVAVAAKSNIRTLAPHPPLLIEDLYRALLQISRVNGSGATKHKQRLVNNLLVAAQGEEVRYLVRMFSQNLRVGAVRTSILAALARAVLLAVPTVASPTVPSYCVPAEMLSTLRSKGSKGLIEASRSDLTAHYARVEGLMKRVYCKHPNYDHIVSALLTVGLDKLEERVGLSVGIPLHPTLGSPAHSLDEIYGVLGEQPFSAECKYDGQRAQIHGLLQGDTVIVKIFSRHLEDMTSKYPDVVGLIESLLKCSTVTSFILDSEIVAVDPDTQQVKSFQELSNRPRKNVQLGDIRVTVCVYAFDIMYLNGEGLLSKSFRRRRDVLRRNFPPFVPERRGAARLKHVESCESEAGSDAVTKFWERAIQSSCEGLMIKLLDSGGNHAEQGGKSQGKLLLATYEPDKRTAAWLKLKKDYVHGIGDTLDLVPIGAWHGTGRKAKWWSPVLLALRDPEVGRHVAVCKCMSGFTDAFYQSLSDRYSVTDPSMCSADPKWESDHGGYQPDVYFKPSEVWEIRSADVTSSPISIASREFTLTGRGLSLRFPRFIRVREDKGLEEASTPGYLAQIWRNQQSRGDMKRSDEGYCIDVDTLDD